MFDLAELFFDEQAEEVQDEGGTPSKSRKGYTVAFKLEVIDYAKKSKSVNSAHKKYNVDRKCVREWMDQEARLRRQKYCFYFI